MPKKPNRPKAGGFPRNRKTGQQLRASKGRTPALTPENLLYVMTKKKA